MFPCEVQVYCGVGYSTPHQGGIGSPPGSSNIGVSLYFMRVSGSSWRGSSGVIGRCFVVGGGGKWLASSSHMLSELFSEQLRYRTQHLQVFLTNLRLQVGQPSLMATGNKQTFLEKVGVRLLSHILTTCISIRRIPVRCYIKGWRRQT